MRVIGQYKGKDVIITDMHISETYGGCLLGPSGKFIEEHNRILINEDVPDRIFRYWGKDRIFCVINLEKIDYKKLLPRVEVIAWLHCDEPVKDKKAHGSHLIMVWYQESAEDPFEQAVINFGQIVWEDKARDFRY